MDKYTWIVLLGTIFILGILGLLLVFPIMWLWNYLMPMVFGLPKLTYWQTYGLYLLVNMFVPHSTSTSHSKN